MALAWLAARWVRHLGGDLLGFVVDHGLRPDSAAEAAATVARLKDANITARLLTLDGLAPGPALAERARAARYAALARGCAKAGLTDLLLGHHAADQAETLMMRALAGTAAAGFAGMAAQRETASLRLLRPLLTVPPARLRATLHKAGLVWIDDPSNSNPAALRGRLRAAAGKADLAGLTDAAAAAGRRRALTDQVLADLLAERAALFPEGYALLTPGRLPAEALAALLLVVSGAAYPISPRRVARLAWAPAPATVAGVRLLAAGNRLLLVREAAAQAADIPARQGALWDGRFRLLSPDLPGVTIGALGADAARWRKASALPSAVLQTLPAIRRNGIVAAVPHLGYDATVGPAMPRLLFSPAEPACGAPWVTSAPAIEAFGDA